jgi:hypothetical protein
MRLFAIGIKPALNVSVQCPHDADGAFTPTARDERGPEFVIVSFADLAER